MIQYYGCLVWILSADGLSLYNIDTKQPFASNIDSKLRTSNIISKF